ncbi:MAG: aminodeoxychorismate synthase, component I [Candidatus Omnitrophica bacterium CG1_02_44_16]|nr:MAG: aminodeoxychorismate synthase, component I [Candidatus Omnitrophica bacterium CG1_02_44_16]PIY82539.1 MAG: aminodeoxychorismate synthase, component I [Candidatus Omnitrophica bacterium CG_4_10_14_0_8_um_filter_44_12]
MKNSAYKIFKDNRTAHEVFAGFKDDRLPFLLESSQDVCGMGRYSFLGSDPFLVFSVKRDKSGSALAILRELFRDHCLEGEKKASIPFLCGAVGFLSYDLCFSLERVNRKNKPDPIVPDVLFAFYDRVVALDHFRKEITVFSSGFPEKGALRRSYSRKRLDEALLKLKSRKTQSILSGKAFLKSEEVSSNFTKSRYLAAIRKVKEYIAAGDIYQVNLSQRLKSRFAVDDWLLYGRLVKKFPVPFSAFLKYDDFSILSASPERFLSYDGNIVTTRPMKGTRPRAKRGSLDNKLKAQLIASPKEKAELLMIVDLERNDLGRVCDYGSIKARHLRAIETYASVFQATAEIQGRLHRSKDRFDLLRACFPGGSVTGCPKIRAMEIIEELEPDARSIYTGALGFLSFHNTLEFNIIIRSFLKKGDDIFFSVGGGIVTDSKPLAEYNETLVKAKALLEALTKG